MNILYFDLSMGAAGDMLCASLWSLVDNKKIVLQEIKDLNIPCTDITFENCSSLGITGIRMNAAVNGDFEETADSYINTSRTLDDVLNIVDGVNCPQSVKDKAKEIYCLIAEAEAKAHGKDAGAVHFHELGMYDAIADIVTFCLLIYKINPDRIVASPINLGKGFVRCAHGLIPVPAPATAMLLEGLECYSNEVSGELCTPTGAAIIKCFVDDFGNMPPMKIVNSSAGIGSREFDRPNCVRAFLGNGHCKEEKVALLSCNIDDMTPEDLSFACQLLLKNNALDAFTQSINMKKGRAAIMLNVICRECEADTFADLIFKHTSTIGIRKQICDRYVLSRKKIMLKTEYGMIRAKESFDCGCKRIKPEFDDVKRIAEENNISVFQVRQSIEKSGLTTTDCGLD